MKFIRVSRSIFAVDEIIEVKLEGEDLYVITKSNKHQPFVVRYADGTGMEELDRISSKLTTIRSTSDR